MADYKKYINALRKCAKEHENDRTFTGHIIVADLCRDTANLLEEIEQEIILDKIRAEIDGIEINGQVDEHTMFIRTGEQVKQMALDIIDKYR